MGSIMFLKGFIIFTDGASKGNPGKGGWGAVLVNIDKEVVELGGGSIHAANNQMELNAILEAINFIDGISGNVHIYTDSKYVIQGVQNWLPRWKKNSWINSQGEQVKHVALWKKLDSLINQRQGYGTVFWHHVPGHAGVAGNERADYIASNFAAGKNVELYSGPYEEYKTDLQLHLLSDDNLDKLVEKKKQIKAKKAYSYLSLVGGVIERHESWESCKKRVSGQKNAKYKKTFSEDDEKSLIEEWTQ